MGFLDDLSNAFRPQPSEKDQMKILQKMMETGLSRDIVKIVRSWENGLVSIITMEVFKEYFEKEWLENEYPLFIEKFYNQGFIFPEDEINSNRRDGQYS